MSGTKNLDERGFLLVLVNIVETVETDANTTRLQADDLKDKNS